MLSGCVSAEPIGIRYDELRDTLAATAARPASTFIEVDPQLDIGAGITAYLDTHTVVEFVGRTCAWGWSDTIKSKRQSIPTLPPPIQMTHLPFGAAYGTLPALIGALVTCGTGMDDVAVVLAWTYSPADYFEEPLHIEGAGYTILIDDGKIEARTDAAVYDKGEEIIQDELRRVLEARFLEVQLATYRKYELTGPHSKSRLRADGTCSIGTVFAQPLPAIKASIGTVGVVISDSGGNAVTDTAEERSDRYRAIAELAAKYQSQDGVVKSLLASYQNAIDNANSELVHLYGIPDALKKRFRTDGAAKAALGISDADWSQLERLANGEPIRQGRHEGAKIKAHELRDATDAELAIARDIAVRMIEAYLRYLEKKAGT